MKKFLHVLLWVWELPQNLIGCLLLLFITGEVRKKLGTITFYYAKRFPGGITLGEYIIVGTDQELTVRHEYGHVLQSRILGPLYLFVIGIPSILHAAFNDVIKCDTSDLGYYHFYTEKWANNLGGLIVKNGKLVKYAKK